MNFRGRSADRRLESVIDITSLVDVVFLLIIFLLVTTTFKRREHAFVLDLPTATHTDLVVRTDRTTVYVSQKGELFYLEVPAEGEEDAAAAEPTEVGEAMSQEDLEKRLRALAERQPNVELSVRAQKDAPYRHIVGVLELCRKVGIRNVLLPAEYAPGGEVALPAGGDDRSGPPPKPGESPESTTTDKP